MRNFFVNMTLMLILLSTATDLVQGGPVVLEDDKVLPLVTFDGTSGTTFNFKELNDPVMGGKSSGTWETKDGVGIIDGDVVDVPSLKAPGFIKASADGKFADVSSSSVQGGGLRLRVRSSTPTYDGFRVSFASGTMSPSYSCAGGGSIPFSRGCFKAHFNVPDSGGSFTDVFVKWTDFSDLWSPATGDLTKTCQDDASACVTAKTLRGIKRMELWAEGKDGKIHLEVQRIDAIIPSSSRLSIVNVIIPTGPRPPTNFDRCSTAVQDDLRWGISGRDSPAGVPAPVDPSESLAEAVCCDSRALPYAEPQFLYEAPDVSLFTRIDSKGITTFYDSVCGLPVFRAPVDRSFDDWKADTEEHGWPSFRTGEVVMTNVITNVTNGLVSSKCGTHLGTFLPDDSGDRWCIDLSCIAGKSSSD